MATIATISSQPAKSRGGGAWFVTVLLAAGFWLRLRLAGLTFLNPDEALHYFLSQQTSWKLAYEASLTTAHPPLMILVLHYWLRLGRSELLLRFPFVLAGTLFCWVMFLWLRRVASCQTAYFALALFLFAPSLISLSAEIRQYPFLLVLCAGALYSAERSLSENSLKWAALSAAALYLALLTHYSGLIFAAAVGVYGLMRLVRSGHPARLRFAWIAIELGALAICAYLYESQVSQLRRNGVPSEIAETWLRSSIFHSGEDHALGFLASHTLRLFRYFFSHGTIGVLGFCCFVYALASLWWSRRRSSEQHRTLVWLLLLPFPITMAAALAGVYPYGGTRHDVLLAMFALAGVAIGLDRLPLLASKETGFKCLLLAGGLLICNFFPSPSGPYLRPRNQRRKLMQQAMSYLRQLPPNSTIFTDQQGSMVLNYYLCDERMPLPIFEPSPALLKLPCANDSVLTAASTQAGFNRSTFPVVLRKAWPLAPGQGEVYLFQSGWIDDKEEDWRAELRSLGGNPRNFGPNILVCEIRRSKGEIVASAHCQDERPAKPRV
jgi:4-amino-4-deoxy-L-arabinose transferase-like glycosyltransferase